jgi:hypothetical protein
MIQQIILFSGFISSLPQDAMMAEPGQEGKRTSEIERVRFKSFSDFCSRTGTGMTALME